MIDMVTLLVGVSYMLMVVWGPLQPARSSSCCKSSSLSRAADRRGIEGGGRGAEARGAAEARGKR